jgi:hypothetical protein
MTNRLCAVAEFRVNFRRAYGTRIVLLAHSPATEVAGYHQWSLLDRPAVLPLGTWASCCNQQRNRELGFLF